MTRCINTPEIVDLQINRGSYMFAYELFNLLNELGKKR